MRLTSGFCYEITLKDGSKLRFKFLDNLNGRIRIQLLPAGGVSDFETEARKGGGHDPESLQRIACGDHTDQE